VFVTRTQIEAKNMVAYTNEPTAVTPHAMTLADIATIPAGRFDWLQNLLDQELAETRDDCRDGRILWEIDEEENSIGCLDDSLLLRAALHGSTEIVAEALLAGAFVDQVNNWGQTAIMIAAAMGNHRALRLLIDAGGDLELKCKSGFTALYYSASGNKLRAVSMLLDAGANINAETFPEGLTALHKSCDDDLVLMSFLLIMRGANINVMCHLGWTPLHLAIGPASNADAAPIVAILMALNADMVNSPNNENLIKRSFLSHYAIALIMKEFSTEMAGMYEMATLQEISAWRRVNEDTVKKVNAHLLSHARTRSLVLTLACTLTKP
jgi:hypothetical protein